MDRIENIKKMEEILNKHQDILNRFQKSLAELAESQAAYQELTRYYYSPQYSKDYDASNKGELPEDLACGVLSEDAVFDLFGENYQTAIDMLDLATSIIKQH